MKKRYRRLLPSLIVLIFCYCAAGIAADQLTEDYSQGLKLAFRLPTGGRIKGRPLVDSRGQVLFVSEDRYLYRLDSSGTILRRDDLPGIPGEYMSLGMDDTCYVALRSGRLVALNRTGGVVWNRRLSAPLAADPVIGVDGRIYLIAGDGTMLAMDHRGDLLWQEELAGGAGGQAIIDEQGMLIVPDGRGFLNAWLPWGVTRWRFRLAAELTAVCAGKTSIYAVSSEGTLAAVSRDGTLRWSIKLQSPAVHLVEYGAGIAAADRAGRIYLIDAGGGETLQQPGGFQRVAGLFSLSGGLFVVGEQGQGILLGASRERDVRNMLPGPVERPGAGTDGQIYGGGSDWNLYGLSTGAALQDGGWSQAGGDPGNRWNRRLIGGRRPEELWRGEPDFLLLRALMESPGREVRQEALTIAAEVLAAGTPGKRRYPPYYGDTIREIVTEAFEKPIFAGQRVVNDYPELRLWGTRVLADEAAYASRTALQGVLRYEWSDDTRAAAMRGLGRIGADPDGRSSRTIAAVLHEPRILSGTSGLLRTGMQALYDILVYNGTAPDLVLFQAALSVYRESSDVESRKLALQILRFRS